MALFAINALYFVRMFAGRMTRFRTLYSQPQSVLASLAQVLGYSHKTLRAEKGNGSPRNMVSNYLSSYSLRERRCRAGWGVDSAFDMPPAKHEFQVIQPRAH